MVEIRKEKEVKFNQFFARYYKIITLFLVVVIIILGYYLLAPKYQEVGLGGKYSLATLSQEKQEQLRYLEDLKKMVDNYRMINKSEIEKLNQILPEEKDIPGLFVQFQALAQENGFILTSININQEPERVASSEDRGEIKKLNISLNLIGKDYEALKVLLEAIESNLRLFDVNAIYFNPDSNDYSINLFSYYFIPKN